MYPEGSGRGLSGTEGFCKDPREIKERVRGNSETDAPGQSPLKALKGQWVHRPPPEPELQIVLSASNICSFTYSFIQPMSISLLLRASVCARRWGCTGETDTRIIPVLMKSLVCSALCVTICEKPPDKVKSSHNLLQYYFNLVSKDASESHSVLSNSLWPHGLWNSPGQNTGVGCHSLLQRIFPTQGSNPVLPHCRGILYQLSHKGSPRIPGMGSLSCLQGIFPTQESNQSLLHCKQIF